MQARALVVNQVGENRPGLENGPSMFFIYIFVAPHVKKGHDTVVSDASPRLEVQGKSICLFSGNFLQVQN
jgi:hypothetical protein